MVITTEPIAQMDAEPGPKLTSMHWDCRVETVASDRSEVWVRGQAVEDGQWEEFPLDWQSIPEEVRDLLQPGFRFHYRETAADYLDGATAAWKDIAAFNGTGQEPLWCRFDEVARPAPDPSDV